MAAGHLWLCHLLLGVLLWLQLGSHFCFPAFPGRVSALGCAGGVDLRGTLLMPRGAGRAVQGFLRVRRLAGLPEILGGMEASRSDGLGGRQELAESEGSSKREDLQGLADVGGNAGCREDLRGTRGLGAGELLSGREVLSGREAVGRRKVLAGSEAVRGSGGSWNDGGSLTAGAF